MPNHSGRLARTLWVLSAIGVAALLGAMIVAAYVFPDPSVRGHFWNLLRSAWGAGMKATSHTTLGLILLIIVLPILSWIGSGLYRSYRREGKLRQVLQSTFLTNALIQEGIALLLFGLLWLYLLSQAIYQDHSTFVDTVRQKQNNIKKLKADLAAKKARVTFEYDNQLGGDIQRPEDRESLRRALRVKPNWAVRVRVYTTVPVSDAIVVVTAVYRIDKDKCTTIAKFPWQLGWWAWGNSFKPQLVDGEMPFCLFHGNWRKDKSIKLQMFLDYGGGDAKHADTYIPSDYLRMYKDLNTGTYIIEVKFTGKTGPEVITQRQLFDVKWDGNMEHFSMEKITEKEAQLCQQK